MDHLAIPQQLLVENETLAHITSALRATIGWKYQATDLTRKLESLLFVGHSFQRHIEHLMQLEEQEGYMSVVLLSRPELKEEVEALRQEHAHFRQGVDQILVRLQDVPPTDHVVFAKVSEDMLVLLENLEKHSQKEIHLLQEALLRDEGGEG